jgi:uncharacterized protein YhfF
MDAVRFAFPGPERDRLVEAVLRGEKTAASSLLAEWEEGDEELPSPGERRSVLDSNDESVAAIELTSVDVIRLGDADLDLALAEGEGFKTVSEWRETHERFWREQVIPKLTGPLAVELTDRTKIVVERFRLADES